MILLTGFEPFEGQAVNASWLGRAGGRGALDGDELAVRELPVSFRGARQVLRTAVAELSPTLVVGVGEAGGGRPSASSASRST